MVVSQILDTNMTFVRMGEDTDPRTNYAVKYAAARGHLKKTLGVIIQGRFRGQNKPL